MDLIPLPGEPALHSGGLGVGLERSRPKTEDLVLIPLPGGARGGFNLLTMKHKIPIIPYDKDLKSLASNLRKNMTMSEVLLWNQLKNKQMLGFDFDRQRPLGKYVVDFYCKELRLAIEVDGDSHTYRYDYDDERQRDLEKLGVRFLRFDDLEIKRDINNVMRVIEKFIKENKPASDNSCDGG